MIAVYCALAALGIVALVLFARWAAARLDRLFDEACACYFDDGERG